MTAADRVWERRAAAVLWPLALGALAHVLLRSATGPGRDLGILWRSASSFVAGGPLYDLEREFIYPPLAGWLLAPLGLLPFRVALLVVTAVSAAALVTALLLLVRVVGGRAGSPVTAGVLLLLVTSRPVRGLLAQGNLDLLLLLAEVGVIVLLLRGRDVGAGALLGLVCAVKPTLAPVVLALLVLGRVRAVGVALGTGLVASVAGLLVPDRAVFLQEVLPLLLAGNRDVLARYDRSLDGAAEQLGLPPALALLLRVAALAAACWVAWRRRRSPLAPVEVIPLLMLGTLLASSFSWANYGVYLLPLLMTAGQRGSLVRGWPAWAGVYLFATSDAWYVEGLTGAPAAALGLLPLWGWLLLLGACVAAAARRPPPVDLLQAAPPAWTARPPAPTTPSEGDDRVGHHHDAQRLGPHDPDGGAPAPGPDGRGGGRERPRAA